MHMADMNFLPMSVNDDMTEPVHGSETLRKFLREALVRLQLAGMHTITVLCKSIRERHLAISLAAHRVA